MRPVLVSGLFAAILVLAPTPGLAQAVLGAKSGIVNYVEGKAFLDEKALELQPAQFPEVKENAVLRTEEGRAEVLLTPGVVMRIGENSSFKMITNRLVDTRIELLSGSAVVEAAEVVKETSVTFVCKAGTVSLPKPGIYHFDAEPARVKVFKGAADVQIAGQTFSVPAGKMMSLGGNLAIAEKFNTEETDSLDRWSRRRGELLAMSNVSAANRVRTMGVASNPCSVMNNPMIFHYGSWGYNPYYGWMTYIPCNGTLMSPYGYRYFSPMAVYRAYYAPRPVYNPGNYGGFGAPSYPSMGSSGGGYSGAISSAGSSGSSAPAASSSGSSAASSSGSSSAGHGGGGGGGRGN